MMFKLTSNTPYVRPEPSAPPLPEDAGHHYVPPEPSAPLLPEGGFPLEPSQPGGSPRACSPSRSSAGIALSDLGELAAMKLHGGPAADMASMQRRRQLPPAPSGPSKVQYLQEMPIKILQHAASFLDPRSRRALSTVSTTMNQAARASQTHMQAGNKAMLGKLHLYPNLQSLRLRGDITLDDLKKLPPTLRHLDLGECAPDCGAKSYAAIQYLTTVLPGTGTVPFPQLESLNVKGARIGDRGAQLLAGKLSLKTLNAADGGIGVGGCAALKDSPALESLDMSGNRIGGQGPEYLAGSKSIKTLRLCCCGVTDPGIQALAKNNQLTSLDVSGNYIGNDALRELVASPSLTELDVSCNRPHTPAPQHQKEEEGVQMAFALAEGMVGRATPLASLKADGNWFNDFAAEMLAFPTVKTASLSLKNNLIGPAGAEKLAENPVLKSLDLTQNRIGDEGAQALAGSKSLTTLAVLNCLVTDTGVEALASNRTLKSLNLGNLVTETENEAEQAGYDETANEITVAGVSALAKNRSLTSLSVQGNLCGDDAVIALAKNRTLTSLNVAYTDMTPASVPELARNPVLTSLSVRWNYDLGPQGIQALAKSQSLTSLDARNTSKGEVGAKALEANPRITGPLKDPNFSDWD
ncbi:GALA protein [Ralstonia solanacearum]|uniref:F-box protein n=1 Tax=Ralstonia solanacearum TaxID=305 RepID=UPI0005AC165F|nr:F-box protein [Ralstonia solanacearum]AMP70400.1 GALA protein [Ralstonia solanacearum]MBB6587635.1 GALA protein [Ralstonia solanacearum]MCL9838025.1 GALA protein [Ralstonia solanacearum]MDB0531009.1 GALA protein [Ralstonia solanacearum]MDB0535771.1 GALA protein [Ralstonia solanacearum]